jgi:osmotically-inducible protein OsmY
MTNRNDETITGAVIAAFSASPDINMTNIRVHTEDGNVRLTGVVSSLEEESRAVEEAGAVIGVRHVENDLTVSPNIDISDLEMERCVNDALARDGLSRVGAKVEAGTAFLVGVVSSVSVKEEAIISAGKVKGIRDVISDLEIAAAEPMDDLKLSDNIAEALSDDMRVDVMDLEVTADDGRVILQGNVGDPRQVELATEIVKSVPGVKEVDNRLSAVEATRRAATFGEEI